MFSIIFVLSTIIYIQSCVFYHYLHKNKLHFHFFGHITLILHPFYIHLNTEFVILRQVINFAVATFVFMSGYFVPVEKICNTDFSYKEWILNRGGRLCVPFVIWSLFYSGISLAKDIHHGVRVYWLGYIYRFIVGKSATPFYYIVVLIQLTIITPWLVHVVKDDFS